eukprot:CAMPEP_0185325636 /NCGR_PEP_ID=MMETSP1363-20130426/66856_1 /TAXON_ID=38817 /ORGANISM="Gephyrocapsa oceanica, Strain RCC1303" /LENGTH=79 /DNA_ID=CAMNT_0027924349 /DNA_START=6 /DNA_END=240 /DNA_ORIENTATION=+
MPSNTSSTVTWGNVDEFATKCIGGWDERGLSRTQQNPHSHSGTSAAHAQVVIVLEVVVQPLATALEFADVLHAHEMQWL